MLVYNKDCAANTGLFVYGVYLIPGMIVSRTDICPLKQYCLNKVSICISRNDSGFKSAVDVYVYLAIIRQSESWHSDRRRGSTKTEVQRQSMVERMFESN